MRNKISNRKGFTLVELVVVVAVIAILSGIVIANISSSRSKARDAKRISDIAQIQLALEQYFDRCGKYPALGYANLSGTNNTCPTGISFSSFISVVPKDPSTGIDYGYGVSADNLDYILKATLQNTGNTVTAEGLTVSTTKYNIGPCNPLTTNYCVGPKQVHGYRFISFNFYLRHDYR